MNSHRALVIDKERNNIFVLISENHGKIKIQSDYLGNNFPGLNRGFFITYEFLSFIGSCCPPGGSRKVISSRFVRHFSIL